MALYTILVVDDEPDTEDLYTRKFQKEIAAKQYSFCFALSSEAGIRILKNTPEIEVLLLDINMSGMDGLTMLERIRQESSVYPRFQSLKFIVVTAYGNMPNLRRAMQLGATDFIVKPIDFQDLRQVLHRILQNTADYHVLDRFVGHSAVIMEIKEIIRDLSDHPVNILLEGETGTGKSLLARIIHECSNRRNKPFVDLHCGAIPSNLIESEFFGHLRGAFTGADHERIGKFQLADKGTLFLDEIGTISLNMQIKLLKAIEQQTFYQVGSDKSLKVDVRIIAATNMPLKKLVWENKFRKDLFYRLNVVPLRIPPLRERREDIPLLINQFLQQLNRKYPQQGVQQQKSISPGAVDKLMNTEWLGNARALSNVLENAFLLSKQDTILAEDIILGTATRFTEQTSVSPERVGLSDSGFHGLKQWITTQLHHNADIRQEFERTLLQVTWKFCRGNKSAMARILGMSRAKLYQLLRTYDLEEPAW